MSTFSMFDQVDHSGANPRKTLVNLDTIIRIFAVSERHCFVVTSAYNRDEVEAVSRTAGQQSSGLYVLGSPNDLMVPLNMAASG